MICAKKCVNPPLACRMRSFHHLLLLAGRRGRRKSVAAHTIGDRRAPDIPAVDEAGLLTPTIFLGQQWKTAVVVSRTFRTDQALPSPPPQLTRWSCLQRTWCVAFWLRHASCDCVVIVVAAQKVTNDCTCASSRSVVLMISLTPTLAYVPPRQLQKASENAGPGADIKSSHLCAPHTAAASPFALLVSSSPIENSTRSAPWIACGRSSQGHCQRIWTARTFAPGVLQESGNHGGQTVRFPQRDCAISSGRQS